MFGGWDQNRTISDWTDGPSEFTIICELDQWSGSWFSKSVENQTKPTLPSLLLQVALQAG